MRHLFFALACSLALPAAAQDISSEVAANGIAATRDRLAAISAPDDAQRFALGGLTFLGAVEEALQLRWKAQVSPQFQAIPVLRLPVPPNPNAEPFRAEMLSEMFTALDTEMTRAAAVLHEIPETSDFALDLRPADLWFDIDGNGSRGPGESFIEVAGTVLFARTGVDGADLAGMSIRFDVADSRWLEAYAQLVRGVSLTVLTYDPTDAIARVIAADNSMRELNRGTQMANAMDMMVGNWADTAAAILWSLRSEPNADRAAQALDALEQVVALNRDFWRLAALETDDAAEWIPNDRQHSAMGMTFPEGTGAAWLEVLDDAEALLKGELLIPYWRLGEGRGINLRKLFLDPRPVDIVGWVQGEAALPYAESGPLISGASLNRFDALVEGRSTMFATLLN